MSDGCTNFESFGVVDYGPELRDFAQRNVAGFKRLLPDGRPHDPGAARQRRAGRAAFSQRIERG